jgi:hypothetical protein
VLMRMLLRSSRVRASMANILFAPEGAGTALPPENLLTDYRRGQAKGLVGANGCSPLFL